MPPIDSATHHTETLVFFTLLQLTVIILAARLAGSVALRLGQAAVVGEILVGILLGPSLLGWLAPEPFHYVFHHIDGAPMQVLAQIGLVLLMFQIGLSFEFAHLAQRTHRRAVAVIAFASLVLPFSLGLAVGGLSAPQLSPAAHPLASALFVATAFSITALPILGRIMLEFGLTQTPLGVITISAAAINDVVGWLLLMLVSMIALSAFDPARFALHVTLVLGFFLLAWLVIRPILVGLIHRFDTGGSALPAHTLGLVLAAIFLSAMTTYSLGIFAIFGGFLAGVLLHREQRFAAAWDQQVSPFVTVFFLPIFFTYTGLRTDIGSLNSMESWLWCLLILFTAMAGKFGGAYLAARLAGKTPTESKIIGIMMNTRALMELIIINVGYDLGAISREVFTMLVIMAIVSTVLTAPLLRRWLPAAGLPVGTARG
ncbi:cation:proton antiporter [Halothiobacillus sp. DCM-1]|uniref:cation:proton antiporter n=1 Tax=Halothiobacillus sp. DCM-1 TaxID=3112558 RepID=UPI003244CC65